MVRIVSFDDAVEAIALFLQSRERGTPGREGEPAATRTLVLCGPAGCGKTHALLTAASRLCHDGTVVDGVEARGRVAGSKVAAMLALDQARSLRGAPRYACVEAADAADSAGGLAIVQALHRLHGRSVAPLLLLCNTLSCPLVKQVRQGLKSQVQVLWQRPLAVGRMAAVLRAVAPRSADTSTIDSLVQEADGDMSSAAMNAALQLRTPVSRPSSSPGPCTSASASAALSRKDHSAETRSPWMALAAFMLSSPEREASAVARGGIGTAATTIRALGGAVCTCSWLHANVAGLAADERADVRGDMIAIAADDTIKQLADICESSSACEGSARRGFVGHLAAESCALHAMHASRRLLGYQPLRQRSGTLSAASRARDLSKRLTAPPTQPPCRRCRTGADTQRSCSSGSVGGGKLFGYW